jgi:NAD(P)H-dependent FMN reductase
MSPRIAVIIGSTRPGRRGGEIAQWVLDGAADRVDAEIELVDLAEHDLPLLDEVAPAAHGPDHYGHEHTKVWAETVASFDGFIFVTPEYNHSFPAALKNALDFLYNEWHNKAAGFVSYGIDAGGSRATEQLRLVMAELQIADVRASVSLSLMDDYADGRFAPRDVQGKRLGMLFDQVITWAGALKPIREPAAVAA